MKSKLKNNRYNFYEYKNTDVGFEKFWRGKKVPAGWLSQVGQSINRFDYQNLYEFASENDLMVSDTAWLNEKLFGYFSSGNGVSTFRLPDVRGFYMVGFEELYHQEIGKLEEDKFQGHGHNLTKSGSYIGGGGGNGGIMNCGGYHFNAYEPVSDGINGTPRVGSRTQPRSIPCLRIIKY